MASTYRSSTAPTSTSAAPQVRIASSRSVACAPKRTARGSSNWWTAVSVMYDTAVADGGDDLGDRRVTQEHLETHDHLSGRGPPRPVQHADVAHDDVRVGRDGVDRGVLDR